MSDRGAFHGPLSPVGAAVGVVLASLPFALGLYEPVELLLAFGSPAVGAFLMTESGRVRQLGTGLVASALTLPLLFLALLLVGVVA